MLKPTPETRLGVESLENRELPASAITATVTGSVLKIEGTESADQIRVRHVDNQILIDNHNILVNGVPTGFVSDAGLTRVEVQALGGHDRVDLGNGPNGASPLRLASLVEGGAGDDILIGGADSDSLLGGAGFDQLFDNGKALLRPTLLVVIPGFQPYRASSDSGFAWREYARRLSEKLTEAGTPTTTLLIDWNSWGTNTEPVKRVTTEIRNALSQMSETHDVLLFGHSRGAIFANVLAGQLTGMNNLGRVREILLDPTASNYAQDRYPSSVPAGVAGSVYDDGYAMLPIGLTDGTRISGASYHYVHDEMQRTHQPAISRVMSLADTAATTASTIGSAIFNAGFSSVCFWFAAARGAIDGIAYHTEIEDFYLDGTYVDQDIAAFMADKGGVRAQDQLPVPMRVVTVAGSFDQNHADRMVAALQTARWFGDLAITMSENYVSDYVRLIGNINVEWQKALGNDPSGVRAGYDRVQSQIDGFLGRMRGVHNQLYQQIERVVYDTMKQGVVQAENGIRANRLSTPGTLVTHWAGVVNNLNLPTSPSDTARWLRDRLGSTMPTIARAIWTQSGNSRTTVAGALWNLGGQSRADVVRTLLTEFGGSHANIGNAILRGIPGTSLAQVGTALKQGASLQLHTVARAFSDMGGNTRSAVAGALWNMGGNSRADVARAMVNGIGGRHADIGNAILSGISGSSLANVAYALKNGATINLKTVAGALWDMGGNTRTDVVRAIVNGIGGSYADIGNSILSGISRTTLENVAYALKNGASINLANVANTLWYMGGNTRTHVARTLWNMGGVTRTDVLNAIRSGIGGISLTEAWRIVNGL